MSVVKTPVAIDLTSLGVPAFMRSDPAGGYTVEANVAQADLAARVAAAPSVEAFDANAVALAGLLAQAMTDLDGIINGADPPAGSLTVLQLSNTVRQITTAVKTMARIQRRTLRELTKNYSGTD